MADGLNAEVSTLTNDAIRKLAERFCAEQQRNAEQYGDWMTHPDDCVSVYAEDEAPLSPAAALVFRDAYETLYEDAQGYLCRSDRAARIARGAL